MRILLSAFACLPDRGSEPGVGWNWALSLARTGHDVTVLTQARNQGAIEAWLRQRKVERVNFVYVPLFGNRKVPGGTFGHYIYYYIWQICALFNVAWNGYYKKQDVIHHVTYGGIRTSSYLWLLPRPFMFGPVGGGETCPIRLVAPMGFGCLAREVFRNFLNWCAMVDPLFLAMQAFSLRILVKTEQTERLILPPFRRKTRIAIEIGSPSLTSDSGPRSLGRPLNVLFAGRLIYWKGIDILIDAALALHGDGTELKVDVVGQGNRLPALQDKLEKLQISNISLHGHIDQKSLFALYEKADLFVFPSLHDSSGNVVLEALSFGVPVICLDLGGPPLILGDAGVSVATKGKSYREVVQGVTDAIRDVTADENRWQTLRQKARERAKTLTWTKACNYAYQDIALS